MISQRGTEQNEMRNHAHLGSLFEERSCSRTFTTDSVERADHHKPLSPTRYTCRNGIALIAAAEEGRNSVREGTSSVALLREICRFGCDQLAAAVPYERNFLPVLQHRQGSQHWSNIASGVKARNHTEKRSSRRRTRGESVNLYLKPWPFSPFRANIFRAPLNSTSPPVPDSEGDSCRHNPK